MKWHNWIICGSCLILVFSFSSELFAAKPRMGLSLGVALGGLFPPDLGNTADDLHVFYPEFQIAVDLAFIKAGFSAGLISLLNMNNYSSYYGHLSLFPFMADISLLPLRFFAPKLPFQIFLGGCGGILFGMSDDDPIGSFFCIGPRGGFEYYLGERVVFTLEGRWVFVPYSESYDYFSALLGIRYRFPFLEKKQ